MPLILQGALILSVALTLAGAAAAGGAASGSSDLLLTDFGARSPVTWTTVNDGVMGGRSRGGYKVDAGVLLFTGSTNTNGGGFSSIRSNRGAFDLRGYDGIRLRVRADGRRYTFRLTTASTRKGRYQPAYWADFETTGGDAWQVVDVPFERFRPQWRGRVLSGPALDLAQIDSLGLMIYDKRDGAFRLEADWIRAYRTKPTFSLASYRGTKRPLLVFAPAEADKRLIRQVVSLKGAHDASVERDMVVIVVVAKGISRVGDQPLILAEAKALRDAYDVAPDAFAVRLIGKDGGVKHAAADFVAPAKLHALIDTMPMRRQEMRERKSDS
jgi:monofunctional biosynthetic peptidoglycan transglycosylase